VSENLEQYRRWIYRLAHDMLWEDSAARRILTVDDLAQEGWIAMWRADQNYDPKRGNRPAHLTNAARKRMLDVVSSKKPLFGTEGNRGRWRVPEQNYEYLPEPGSWNEPYDLDHRIERIENGSRYVDLHETINDLPEDSKEYLERVFWGGERLRKDRAAWKKAEAVLKEKMSG